MTADIDPLQYVFDCAIELNILLTNLPFPPWVGPEVKFKSVKIEDCERGNDLAWGAQNCLHKHTSAAAREWYGEARLIQRLGGAKNVEMVEEAVLNAYVKGFEAAIKLK